MLNFVFILSIILEILITSFLILKLTEAQKAVLEWNKKLVLAGGVVVELNKNLNTTVKKINKIVSIFTNKKLVKIAQILKIAISVAQTIILIRSLNFSKGLKVNVKIIKKLMYTQIVKGIIKTLCKYL